MADCGYDLKRSGLIEKFEFSEDGRAENFCRAGQISFLAYRILPRSMIGYWYHTAVCRSVRLSVTLYIVAKRYILL